MSSPACFDDPLTLVPILGPALDDEIASWEAHLETLEDAPSYAAIIAQGLKNPETRSKAIVHVLRTLPTRHALLAASSDDLEMDLAPIRKKSVALLEKLLLEDTDSSATEHGENDTKDQPAEQIDETMSPSNSVAIPSNIESATPIDSVMATALEPGSEREPAATSRLVTTSFQRTLGGKKFSADVKKLEDEMEEEEKIRLQNLRRLKGNWRLLMEIRNLGELDVEVVRTFVRAMELCGVLLNMQSDAEERDFPTQSI